MKESPNVAETIEKQLEDARLRVLIIGAGIAGATLGALLRRRGEPAAMIERGGPDDPGGYTLGLMPLGGRVLNGLGLADRYIASSVPTNDYVMHDRKGREIRHFALGAIVERFGVWRGIERGVLLSLLRAEAGPIVWKTQVQTMKQDNSGVRVTFNDSSTVEVDLVVAADGVHSHARAAILDPSEVTEFDTGWGGFVAWKNGEPAEPETYREFWSAGWGIGLYPVKGRLGLFLAGRHDVISTRNAMDYADELAAKNLPPPFAQPLAALDRNAPAVYWKMSDIRSQVWSRGRILLLGDAAASFLPTAGVGASAAMDSAAALADELARADKAHLDYALATYEKRQRPRVERAQKNSRDLSRFMFVNRGLVAAIRDAAMRFYTLERLLADISRVMDGT